MINKLNDIEIKKVDLTTRTIYINGTIDSDLIEESILAIRYINIYDDKQEKKLKKYKRQPISIIIDTYGGSVYDGMGLVNCISSSKTPIHTYCYSKGMSMGLLLFISGHKRFIHEHATLMFHQLSTIVMGTNQDVKEESIRADKLNTQLMKIIKKRTNITQKQIDSKNKRKQDWFITGKKAIKLGAADELIKDTI